MTDDAKPYIVDIKRNSLDDGPGIRTVIFFKGCPLGCVWCQNPETKSSKQELIFAQQSCRECFDCIETCKFDALDFDRDYPIVQKKCTLCGGCVNVCITNSLRYAGRQYSIGELMDNILKDKVFFQNSGGGVTFSGGEPTMHMNYLHHLLLKLSEEKIHTCLETCGFYNGLQFDEFILPYIDLIYFDLKLYDQEEHSRYCKASNARILKNFEELINKKQMEVLPRIPLIPSITATKDNLQAWARYLKEHQIHKIGFLPYNPLWISKADTVGKDLEYTHSEWLTEKEKEVIKGIFEDFEYRDF